MTTSSQRKEYIRKTWNCSKRWLRHGSSSRITIQHSNSEFVLILTINTKEKKSIMTLITFLLLLTIVAALGFLLQPLTLDSSTPHTLVLVPPTRGIFEKYCRRRIYCHRAPHLVDWNPRKRPRRTPCSPPQLVIMVVARLVCSEATCWAVDIQTPNVNTRFRTNGLSSKKKCE